MTRLSFRTMTLAWGTALLVLASASLAADDTRRVAAISWAELQQQGGFKGGEVVASGGGDAPSILRVANEKSEPVTVQLLSIDSPVISKAQYALRGRVRYTDVDGEGYLELWNCFKDQKKYFTRTLSETGPMRSLKGTSSWRQFVLPFFMDVKKQTCPSRLDLNVILPGRGVVELESMELVEYDTPEAAIADSAASPMDWWTGRMAGLVGGLLGCVLGIMGGIVGLLAPRGKARNLVMGILKTIFVIGLLALVGGILAMVKSQPYAVYYPLLLLGGLCSVLSLYLTPITRKQYEHHELRKMEAMDAARS